MSKENMTLPGLDPSPPSTGRHPHEVFLTAFIVLVSVVGLFTPVSPSIASMLTEPGATAFYLGLVLSGVATLVGIWIPRIEGPLIERIGLGVTALFLLAYIIAVFANSGTRGFMAVAFPTGILVANVARIVQIGAVLKKLKVRR